MTPAFGGDFWIVVVVGGVIVLGAAIAFASYQWRHRDRRLDPVREDVTRRNYEENQEELVGRHEAEPLPGKTPDDPSARSRR